MYQQTQISLNFQQIFKVDQPESHTEETLPQNPLLSSSFTSATSECQIAENYNQANKSVVESSSPKVPIFHRHKLVHSASQQISSIKKLMFNCFAVKLKKPSVSDIEKITKRLIETKSCKKIQSILAYHSNKQQQKLKDSKKKNQLQKYKSTEAFRKTSSISSANVFDRLHYNSKFISLRRSHLKKLSQSHLEESKQSKGSSAGEKYLRNYIPFYKRLQGQLNRTFQTAEIIKKHPKIVSQLQSMTFKPKLYPSPFNKTIKSKYMSTQGKEYTDNGLIRLMNSSVNTTSEAVNRSMEIIDKIQQHFFNKMRLIFVNEQTGEVKVSHQSVSLLSDLEFSVLSTFIIYIQQNQIHSDDFDYYLRTYFYNLSIPQKMQLRSHQTQSRFKYTQFDQLYKTNRKLQQKNSKKKLMSSSSFKAGSRTSRINSSNYHVNIQNFI